MRDFGGIRVGFIALGLPDGTVNCLSFVHRAGGAYADVVVGVKVLQEGSIATNAGFTPGAIKIFQLLFVGVATLTKCNCCCGNYQ
jgi:hypothetical protein